MTWIYFNFFSCNLNCNIGKSCAFLGCGHYRPKLAATAARATKNFPKAVKAPGCSVFSIPSADKKVYVFKYMDNIISMNLKKLSLMYYLILFCSFLDYRQRTGNKHLLSIGLEKIDKLYGICSCHFNENQLSGKGKKKTLVPGEKPSLKCAVDKLDDNLINKLGEDRDTTLGSIGKHCY